MAPAPRGGEAGGLWRGRGRLPWELGEAGRRLPPLRARPGPQGRASRAPAGGQDRAGQGPGGRAAPHRPRHSPGQRLLGAGLAGRLQPPAPAANHPRAAAAAGAGAQPMGPGRALLLLPLPGGSFPASLRPPARPPAFPPGPGRARRPLAQPVCSQRCRRVLPPPACPPARSPTLRGGSLRVWRRRSSPEPPRALPQGGCKACSWSLEGWGEQCFIPRVSH